MANQQMGLGRRLQRKQFKYLVRQIGSRIIDFLQPIVVFGGLAAVLLLKIPWLKDVLAKVGLKDAGGLADTLVVVTLCAIFLEVRAVAQRIDEIPAEQRHFADPLDVYPILIERIKVVTRKEEKVLDVLGMSLYTAWPSIGFWLNRPELRDWTIRMAAVAKADTGVMALFPPGWVDEGRKNLNQINDVQNSRSLASQRINLEPYGYNFVPVIHGFRLGNGDLFYSILNWGADARINRDVYSYEFLPSEDRSSSAEWVRGIFDSWFTRACRDRWPLP